MQQFLADCDLAYNRLRCHRTIICDDLLGFKLLKASNLSNHREQLIKATITKVSYDNILKKIETIFPNDCKKQNTMGHETHIKMEPTFHTTETTSDEGEYKTKNVDDTAEAYSLLTNSEKPPNIRFKDPFTKIKST